MSVIMEFTERRVLRRKNVLLQEALPLTTNVLLDFKRQGLLKEEDIKAIRKCAGAQEKMDLLLEILNNVQGFSIQKLCYLLEQQKLDWVADEIQAELLWEKGKLKVEYYIQKEADILMNKHLLQRRGKVLDALDISQASVAVAGKMQVTKNAWQRQVNRKGRVVSDEVSILQEDIDRMSLDIGAILSHKDSQTQMMTPSQPDSGRTPRIVKEKQSRQQEQDASWSQKDWHEKRRVLTDSFDEAEEDGVDVTRVVSEYEDSNNEENDLENMNKSMKSENGLVRFIGGRDTNQSADSENDTGEKGILSERTGRKENSTRKGDVIIGEDGVRKSDQLRKKEIRRNGGIMENREFPTENEDDIDDDEIIQNDTRRENAIIHENEVLESGQFSQTSVARNDRIIENRGFSTGNKGDVDNGDVRERGHVRRGRMVRENAMIQESGGQLKDLDSSYDSDIPMSEHDTSTEYDVFERTTPSTKSSGIFSDDNRVQSGRSHKQRKQLLSDRSQKSKTDGRFSVATDSGRGSVQEAGGDQQINKVETKHTLVKKLSNKIRELSQVLQDVLTEQQALLAERHACYQLLGIDPDDIANSTFNLQDMLKSKLQSVAKAIDDKEYEVHHGNSMAQSMEEKMHTLRQEMARQISFKNSEVERLQRQIHNYEQSNKNQTKVMEKGRHDREILLSQIEYWKRRCDLLEKSRRLGYYYEHWYHSSVGKKCCILNHSTDLDSRMLAQYEKLGVQYGKMAFDQAISSLPDLSKVGADQAGASLTASWSEADYAQKLTTNPHANTGKDVRFHYRSPYVGPSTVKNANTTDQSPRRHQDAATGKSQDASPGKAATAADSDQSPRPPQGGAPARKFRVNRPCRSNSPERPAEQDSKVLVKHEHGTVTYSNPEHVSNLHHKNKEPVFHHRSCCPACCAIARRMKQK